ncbi:MAG: hypothetical protein JNL96_14395 [Planctomycetaceae bacterium]|nr:hypothetical protein [Planctomycetaceae bacterium]
MPFSATDAPRRRGLAPFPRNPLAPSPVLHHQQERRAPPRGFLSQLRPPRFDDDNKAARVDRAVAVRRGPCSRAGKGISG